MSAKRPRPELIPVTRSFRADPPFVHRTPDGRTEFHHVCGDLFERYNVIEKLPIGDGGWQWEDGALMPPIYCRTCGLVGFWSSQGWVPL